MLAREVLAADDDRRGAEAVLREHAGGDRARLAHDEQHVVALPVLDLRGRGAERDARDRQQRFRRGRRVADGHLEAANDAGVRADLRADDSSDGQPSRPWQCLYFLPDPHGHGSLRPTFSPARTNGGGARDRRVAVVRRPPASASS